MALGLFIAYKLAIKIHKNGGRNTPIFMIVLKLNVLETLHYRHSLGWVPRKLGVEGDRQNRAFNGAEQLTFQPVHSHLENAQCHLRLGTLHFALRSR
jgi:hypothetical protein